ncbi:4Fe-4S cluster-binding domain-containing protein [Brachyspira hyodysenteriae]|uniref:radical SAM protein n=1 Tax=Brachyspira hyodysenteriae TaxID=159 RepID=UPI0022CD2C83|nr:4Fe-4S cluster-binding domain-containing protein [Brachyspira hyodysenteriae]MCZ9868964.1 4Fe-4S cluster-binding domain-containing protein [Brachyspira hyodysenteriae]MCZ9877311.1 4Fe-4S cluster-binding domain-containing protein [Brachyspira hyodysenteriae]MCZ9898908.1 4Fe-4S cluster-binding domain-containing protein [Brachyspira hyodysenteriae]MCZ9941144.1 4Fe-4S cluster-binding domain-containing protein [Brachyspira hyodysenteriae]MCZ9952154.1 4Fe-4S cluster-binding domain-containing prot
MNRKVIDEIVWWIPFKKWRGPIRYFLEDVSRLLNTEFYTKDEIMNMFRRVTPRIKFHRVEIHLVEHCNLNCQSCTHFSQIAEKEFLDIEIFEKDIKQLSSLTNGNIERIRLMGGEPLLHPNCPDFFTMSRKYFKYSEIQLVTNAVLLVNKDDNFWKSLKENNIVIEATKYPIKIDWDKIIELCNNYNVKINVSNGEGKDIIKTSYKYTIDVDGKQDALESFVTCWFANSCPSLKNGKLFTCPIACYINHFNKFFGKNIPTTENDYIDIHKANSYDELLNFIAKPIPLCKYCDIKNRKYEIPWKTSSKNIDEYI